MTVTNDLDSELIRCDFCPATTFGTKTAEQQGWHFMHAPADGRIAMCSCCVVESMRKIEQAVAS